MDTAELADLVSKMQGRVQVAADALQKVVSDNLSPDSTPGAVDLNMALLQVDTIAADLQQLGFEVEDALNRVGHADNGTDNSVQEGSASLDVDDDDVVPVDWSPDELLCSDDSMPYESDRSGSI
jgi:hypothetical protein